MRRILSLGSILLLGVGFQDPAAGPPAFEGALVVEAPPIPEGLVPGDILLSLDGRPVNGLPLLRRQLAESLNSVIKGRVRRQGTELALEWTPPPGSYRLADWPSPAELFRRTHGGDLDKPGVQAALAAVQAASDGKARTALRQIERATAAGLRDPLLDWAEAAVLVRYENNPSAAEAPLKRAFEAVEKAATPADRRIRGLCLTVLSYKELLHERNPAQALRHVEEARASGIDVSELSRSVAGALAPGSRELWTLKLRAFEDDALDRGTAEWLAGHAPTPDENALYADWVRRLSGVKRSDPVVELAGLIAALRSTPQRAAAMRAFLEAHPELTVEDRARGLDALARSLEAVDDAAAAFDVRMEALTTAPSVPRATIAARVARRIGRYGPVLRYLRSLDNPQTNDTSKRAYLSIYTSLSTSEMIGEGAAVIQEAVRLERRGRPEEAAGLLLERADACAQPELRVTAGLLLRHAGFPADFRVYFEEEMRFWNQWMWSDPAHTWRFMLLMSRLGQEFGGGFPNRGFENRMGATPAVAATLQASFAWNSKQPDKAAELLRTAVSLLGQSPTGSEWIPFYAEGHLVRTPAEWIAALAESYKMKLDVPRGDPTAAFLPSGPAAAMQGNAALQSVADLVEEADRIVTGTAEPSPDSKQFFHVRCGRALKGTIPFPVLGVNAASAQEWHPQAIAKAVSPGEPVLLLMRREGTGILVMGRLFIRVEGDLRRAEGDPWLGASRIDLGMNRTFEGTVAELEAAIGETLKDRTKGPAPKASRLPLTPELLGVPVGAFAPLWAPYLPEGEGFLRHWLVLGPIELGEKASDHTAESQKAFFDKEWYPGQATDRPRAGIAPPIEHLAAEWGERETGDFALDLGATPNCLWLGVVYVFCERELPGVILSIGSDDGSRWTLNGVEAIRIHAGRGIDRDQNKSGPLTLKAGLNVLAFQVINGGGGCGACARFLDSAGRPIRDFAYGLSPAR